MCAERNNDQTAAEFARLLEIVRELRTRCPWDRDQTLADTTRYLIEEAYEAADAIAAGDLGNVAEELGDLIVQAIFAGVIAAENGALRVDQMLKMAADKLIRRHPHVYGESKAETVGEVLEQWDQIKSAERAAANKVKTGTLDDTGRGLPALMRAEKLGERARRLGMDWPDARQVIAKVREELDEVERALERGDDAEVAEELGDMMLALANVPRFIGRNAEETLRRGCDKFVARFGAVERLAAERGIDLKTMSPGDVEALWQEAKRIGN